MQDFQWHPTRRDGIAFNQVSPENGHNYTLPMHSLVLSFPSLVPRPLPSSFPSSFDLTDPYLELSSDDGSSKISRRYPYFA